MLIKKDISSMKEKNGPSAGLLRRLVAIFYDILLLFSVLFFAAALAYPITDGQISPAYQFYLLLVWFLYFAWPWLRSGQTLGMKAWRIKLESTDGQAITWWQALQRFLMAFVSCFALGMGFFWTIVDKQQRSWHDLVSNTRMVLLVK